MKAKSKFMQLITNIAFVTLIFTFTGSTLAQNPFEKERAKIQKLKIKNFEETAYPYKFGEPSEVGQKITDASFDANGNLTELSVYGEEGEELFRFSYGYDANNNTTEEAKYDAGSLEYKYGYKFEGTKLAEKIVYGGEGEIESKVAYKYNADGDVEKETEFDSEGLIVYRQVFKYTDKRELEKSIKYDGEGVPTEKFSYKYDDAGNLTQTIAYDADGAVLSKHVSKFDEAGNLTEQLGFDSDGSLLEKMKIKYDEKGMIEEKTKFGDDSSILESYNFKYDDKGRVIEEILSAEGERVYTKEFKYNSNDDIEELLEDVPDDEIYVNTKFTYDDSKRLVQKIIYDRLGEPIKMIKIEYDLY